jgi:pimeloyl-ACP methyl ester carboxylesterase
MMVPLVAAAPPATAAGGVRPPLDCGNAHRRFVSTKAATDGSFTPVVLVHGITSSGDQWLETPVGGGTPFAQSLAVIRGVAVYTFDYPQDSLDWVTADAISGELSTAISCLVAATGHRAVAVGHSMGGLAVQVAQSQVGSKVGRVVTIGSPVQGSQLLTVADATLDKLTFTDPSLAALSKAILAWCGFDGRNRPHDPTCGFLAARDTPAGRAMTPGAQELAALPPWRAGLPVERIAAEMEVSIPGGKSVRVGDIAVARASATTGGTEKPFVDTCDEVAITKVFSNTCVHGNETRNPVIIAHVVHELQKTLGAKGLVYAPDVHDVDFANALLPAGSCDPSSPALQLSNGNGSTSPSTSDPNHWEGGLSGPVLFADVDTNGKDEAIVGVACAFGGGNGVVNSIWAFDVDRSNALVAVGGRISGITQSEYSPILSAAVDGHDLVVTEKVWRDIDYHCCPTQQATTRWHYDGTKWNSTVVSPVHPAGLDPDGLSTDGVAPLKFGDTVDRAQQVVGQQATTPTCGVGLTLKGLPGLTLHFSNGIFDRYYTDDQGNRTLSGAHVGMSIDELTAAVPFARPERGPYGNTVYVVRSDGNALVFSPAQDGGLGTRIKLIGAGVGDVALYDC